MKEKSKKLQPKKRSEPSKEELLDLAKRIQADFENYKKRAQSEREELREFANTDLIFRMLPILDNFKLATKHLPEGLREDNWTQGVLQIERQLEQTLTEEGLAEIKSVGEEFDPHVHDAVSEENSEEANGIVIEEIQKGYMLNGKIIRHAKVKVSKGKEKTNE